MVHLSRLIRYKKGRSVMIDFKVFPIDAGWEDIHININGDKFNFHVSYIGDTFFQMISAAAALMGTPPYENFSDTTERREAVIADGIYDLAAGVNVTWDQEGQGLVEWILTKPVTLGEEFTLHIEVTLLDIDEKHAYDVDFREFCYALAKCFTEALKNTGICGYYDATFIDGYGSNINLKEFIYVKAFALKKLNEFKTTYVANEQGKDKAYTDFQKEMELIMQDM